MNTKYSIKKVWYYLFCMIMTLQLIACTEETHESYTAAPEVEDIYIDQLEELINKMKDLQKNSEYGEKKGQYPTESRAILTDAIDDANRSVLLIKYQNPVPSEQEKQRYVAVQNLQLISLRVLFVRKMLKQHLQNCLLMVKAAIHILISDVVKNMLSLENKVINHLP